MSDKPSDPKPKLTRVEINQLLERIKANATARVPEVLVSDPRALEGEDYLVGVGETYLRQQIKHTNQLHIARLLMLLFLLGLVILWLGSIPLLLYLVGTGALLISDTVLVVYIGATTINVLGLLKIAAKWLFGDKSSEAEQGLLDSIKEFFTK